MKKSLLCLAGWVLCCLPSGAVAQSAEPFLWPLEGIASGEGVLFGPQSHVGDELNFDNLFISATGGTPVVAPTDGVVGSFQIVYCSSLTYSTSCSIADGENMTDVLRGFTAGLGPKDDPKFASFQIGLRLSDGRCMYIGGMKCDRVFRTGEKIRRGERLGVLAYSYHKIPEPSLKVSISDRAGKPTDPQKSFGIRSTFVPPTQIPRITSLTGEQARADFTTLMDVLTEAYPGLYDHLTPEELETFRQSTLAAIPEKIDLRSFFRIIKRTVSELHDSHLMLYPMQEDLQRRSVRLPQIYFGWIGSQLTAIRCTKEYASYYGRAIRSVDGIPADSLRSQIACNIGGYDGCVESVPAMGLALSSSFLYGDYHPSGIATDYNFTFEFTDGERLETKGWNYSGGDPRGLAPDWKQFILINDHDKANFGLKILDDSTAYMGLSTFELNQVEVDSLASFVRSVADRPNLIVDVRNNGGGSVEVLRRILSFFAQKPFAALGGYSWVPKVEGYTLFEKCCMNYTSESSIVSGYRSAEGKPGFYLFDDSGTIVPDSTTHYGGRLYVLVNERSCSAATYFPATILRNHRGVIVGRETSTAYHYMNAEKFAEIRLPNSWLMLRMPLVRCVFDTTENLRIPYGRGVIPDHCIDLTLDEVAVVRGDSVLRYTLALIDRGEYLGDDPFFVPEETDCCWIYWAAGAALLGVAGVVLLRRRNGRKSA